MAGMSFYFENEVEKYRKYRSKLITIVYRGDEGFKKDINLYIDELNSIEYTQKIAGNEEACQLLCHCCTLVPTQLDQLLTKFAQLTVNLITKLQMELSDKCLNILVEYYVLALQQCPQWTWPDILHALATVLYENGHRIEQYEEMLLSEGGLLVSMIQESHEEEVIKGALICLENACIRVSLEKYIPEKFALVCFKTFAKILEQAKGAKMEEVSHCKLIVHALRGLQNVIVGLNALQTDQLGLVLAIIKVYIYFGTPQEIPLTTNMCLYPTPMSQYAGAVSPNRIPLQPPSPTPKAAPKVANKKNKKRRPKKVESQQDDEDQSKFQNRFTPGHQFLSSSLGSSSHDTFSLRPHWNRISSSESEYSDTEGEQAVKTRSIFSRVRLAALSCLLSVVKITERKIMFGYWSAFIPDSPGGQTQTLFTTILKDGIPKVRCNALTVLTALLEGSKQYLAVASEDSKNDQFAFTSYSFTLSSMVKQLHTNLLMTLASENSPLAITQTIKCLATLVINVPYQKFKPGLLSRVAKQIKPFVTHRDPNIRVACLTCYGSIVTVNAPLLEVFYILNPIKSTNKPKDGASEVSQNSSGTSQNAMDVTKDTSEVSQNTTSSETNFSDGAQSGSQTPGSGSLTPRLEQMTNVLPSQETPWLVRLCVGIIRHTDDSLTLSGSGCPTRPSGATEPLPVVLEALQVLVHLAKSYFPLIRHSVVLLRDTIQYCCEEADPSVQLHGAKLLEALGPMILTQIQPAVDAPSNADRLTLKEGVDFWLSILDKPIRSGIQNQNHAQLRATICDCISNIGAKVFEQFSMRHRISCVTLLLGVTSDEDCHVRASAIRALGVFVLYPCLREDVCFVADTANKVIELMEESNLSVRIKTAWVLGNISDALVVNKEENDEAFLEDFSDVLLLRLFNVASKAAQDNDKVKSNGVRAIGNLVRYIQPRSWGKKNVVEAIDQAIIALTKAVTSGSMKARWNACYAVGNMFKNPLLPVGTANWTSQIYSSLCSVVKDCKNYKVRINAALALSNIQQRSMYGDSGMFLSVWRSLIEALESTEDIHDFADYKYRDTLVDQICVTVVQLVCLIAVDDLVALGALFFDKSQHVDMYLSKHIVNISSLEGADRTDKESKLQEAVEHMRKLSESQLTKEQHSAWQILTDILEKPVQVKESAKETRERSGFLETYD
ncbi:unnamed protein product [Owenia fusiformis]|uniref:HEAT repeat-containing protein 6 n=1 Tax=Owenia fusiformis TaxID=6347 RepID=A0A8S4QAY4_OWEFU|nr:unnamed protein product [Owenia fusiformis]